MELGEVQSAVSLQDCLAGILAIVLIGIFEYGAKSIGIFVAIGFRYAIASICVVCA